MGPDRRHDGVVTPSRVIPPSKTPERDGGDGPQVVESVGGQKTGGPPRPKIRDTQHMTMADQPGRSGKRVLSLGGPAARA